MSHLPCPTSRLTADVPTFKAHVTRLAKAGMQPVVCGSMGEAFHLTAEERLELCKAAREALDEAGLSDTVLVFGTCVDEITHERGLGLISAAG